jgi:regulatory protein
LDEIKSVAGQITEICLRLLSYREHSRQELLQKLTLKGFAVNLVQPVLDELALKDWQSDQRYANSYAKQRLQKGYGALRIIHELRQRGIAEVDLDSAVMDVTADWMALLEQTYLKKYTFEPCVSRHEWAKRSRFLLQRGFSAEMIGRLFKHLHLKFE